MVVCSGHQVIHPKTAHKVLNDLPTKCGLREGKGVNLVWHDLFIAEYGRTIQRSCF